MHESERDIDPSIELVPIEVPAKRLKKSRTVLWLVLGAGAVALSLAALFVVAAIIARLHQSRAQNVSVAAHQDAATLRLESAQTFAAFDAIDAAHAQLSDAERQERDAIDALFREISTQAAAGNNAEFRKQIDADRLMKRIELTGNVPRWSQWTRNATKLQILASTDVDALWSQFQIAGILTPPDDAATRVVYAYCSEPKIANQAECRFWIARDGDQWKVYDWSRLDLGMSKSYEWGLYIKYGKTRILDGFDTWGKLISEADKAMREGDHAAAEDALHRAEILFVPDEFQGFRHVLTGHRWMALGEPAEAARSYLNVSQPDDTPGAYFGLMTCNSNADRQAALRYADLYEQTVGPSKELLEEKCQILKSLGRNTECARERRKLLRLQPANAVALRELFFSLPKDDKSDFTAHLDRLEDPAAAIASIAPAVGYRDFQGLQFLADHLRSRAPAAAGTHYVAGLKHYLDGQYDEAAKSYRLAFDAETNEDYRASYINSYVEAMVADGQVAAAMKAVPDQKSAIESLLYSYDEGDTQLSDDEYRQLVALCRTQDPDDLDAMLREAQLAADQNHLDDAKRLLRAALEQAEKQPDDENIEIHRDAIAAVLAATLYKQGGLREAYETGAKQRDRFTQLARLAIVRNRWDDVRSLLDWHRANDPDDWQIQSISGELAAHEKKWDEATQLLQQSLAAASEQEKWLLRRRLTEYHLDAGSWLEFLGSIDQKEIVFEIMANRFVEKKDWESLKMLIAERRTQSPTDLGASMREAQSAWDQNDYYGYIAVADELLKSAGTELQSAERSRIENQLLVALLRTHDANRARDLAMSRKLNENDAVPLAISYAAEGSIELANATALTAASHEESAVRLYFGEYMGPTFLGEKYRALQNEYPVPMSYRGTAALAVFLIDDEMAFDVPTIEAALKELNIDASVKPLKIRSKNNALAFAVPLEDMCIWMATGSSKFDDGWQIDDEASPLAAVARDSNRWFAVGTAGWNERGRDTTEATARRLSSHLAGKSAVAVYARGRELWAGLDIYRADPQILSAWSRSGDFDTAEQRTSVIQKNRIDVAAVRKFERSLRDAAREFESRPSSRLRVVTFVSNSPSIDPLRLTVRNVRRLYGGLEFDGVLENGSALVTVLSEGLPMRFAHYEIQAWQLDNDPPVYRPLP